MQFHDVFCEITYQPGEIPEFYYRSGLAVYKEQFKNGSLVAAGWNTAGYLPSRKNMGETDAFDYLTEPAAFHLELNGQCADYGFRLVDFQIEKQQHGQHAILVLESTIFPIRVLVHTSVDETQSFSRWLEVENLSEEPWSISRIAVYNGVLDSVRKKLPYPGDLLGDRNVAQEEYFSLGYFRDGGWGREGDFGWQSRCGNRNIIQLCRRSKNTDAIKRCCSRTEIPGDLRQQPSFFCNGRKGAVYGWPDTGYLCIHVFRAGTL